MAGFTHAGDNHAAFQAENGSNSRSKILSQTARRIRQFGLQRHNAGSFSAKCLECRGKRKAVVRSHDAHLAMLNQTQKAGPSWPTLCYA